MEYSKLHVIDNTKKAQDEFGHSYGSEWLQISIEQLVEIISGKQLAFSDGEYTTFISLENPK